VADLAQAVVADPAPPTWRLTALYDGQRDARLDADLDAAGRIAAELAGEYQGRLAALPATDLGRLLDRYEECLRLLQRVDGYLELLASAGDAVDPALATRCDTAWAAVVEHAGFIEAELTGLDPTTATELRRDPRLARHAPLLARVDPPGRRPAAEEQVLARLAVTGGDGWTRLGRQLLGRVRVQLDDRTVAIPAAMAALRDPERTVRDRAHEAMSRALEPELDLRATALGMIATDQAIRAELRGLPSWLAERHQLNQVGAAEIDVLLEIAGAHLDLAHDYFATKALVLGASRDVDRYAPVGAEPATVIGWADAGDLVTQVFASLAEPLGAEVRGLLADGHVDARPRPGKSGRPFTRATGPGSPVFVSLSFTGQPRDVLTLAHELGHAVHLEASAGAGLFGGVPQPVLAETVALFFEGLAAGRLGAELTEPAERVWFLARQLDTLLISPLRQVVLHRFEDRLHRHAASAGPPGADQLADWWLDSQRMLYGPAMTFGADFGLWWSCLDSFVTAPGSLYGYVYGGLAANVLLDRYRDGAAGSRERLLDLMAAGSTRPPAQLLRLVGVDVENPASWTHGFGFLRELLAEFRSAATSLPAAADAGHSGRAGGDHVERR
jgi:oligoendopeptidase F